MAADPTAGLCDYCGHSTTHYDHTACTPEAEAARETDHGDPGPDLPEQVAGWTVPDTTNEENERMSQQQNRRALRWSVPVDDQWHPIGGGQVLHVDARSNGTVEVWTLETTIPEHSETRTVRVYGTGHRIAEADTEHIGTALTPGGALVWHVFGGTR